MGNLLLDGPVHRLQGRGGEEGGEGRGGEGRGGEERGGEGGEGRGGEEHQDSGDYC